MAIDWRPPEVDESKKPRVKVAPCEGCGQLPHPGELACVKRALRAAKERLEMLGHYVAASQGAPLDEATSRRMGERLQDLIRSRRRPT